MARARNIKPGFFTNGDLADCSPLARLLFIGLWGICDREGRLIDKPRDIKAKTLPYDECDCDTLLWELDKSGFIRRYSESLQPGGEKVNLIWVPRFVKHQHIHVNEPDSELPEFKGESLTIRTNPDLSSKVPPILNAERGMLKDELLNVESTGSPKVEPQKGVKRENLGKRFEVYFGELTPSERGPLPYLFADWAAANLGWNFEQSCKVFDTFRDYWRAQPGQKGVKTDWPATWRNWCRRHSENGGRGGGNGGKTGGNLAAAVNFSLAGRGGVFSSQRPSQNGAWNRGASVETGENAGTDSRDNEQSEIPF